MSYRKISVIDGDATGASARRIHVAVYVDGWDAAPVWETVAGCDTCTRYFACTFRGAPCRIKQSLRDRRFPVHVSGENMKVLATQKNCTAAVKVAKAAIRKLQKTR